MGYTSKHGRRPNEYASKSAHSHIINDSSLQEFLSQCNLPKSADEVTISDCLNFSYEPVTKNPIRNIIAIDGGYSEVSVQTGFPSSTVCFFQIGALIFSIDDLDGLGKQPFIDPDDMAKLKQIQRLKLTLPVRNIQFKSESTLVDSVRRTIHNFFCQKVDNEELIATLRWFIFQEYDVSLPTWNLASCPVCGNTGIPLNLGEMTKDYTFSCNHCNAEIFLTDVFRLHETIDEELGAGSILGYLMTTLEQIILVHLIRVVLKMKPALLGEILFVKDGPLAFFGQTANMHRPMRALVNFLFRHHNLYLAGLEKSGAFVEHADEISEKLANGTVLILNNDYIYKYILPGKADPSRPYGSTTYYSNKLIFKTLAGGMYIVSLPTSKNMTNPKEGDFQNLGAILTNIEKLKCDMYDSSLIPIALANKLVSLADHPSSRILQKFAKGAIIS
ncbi:DNA double-strand break repair nuclease NurA (plasmid) [Tolypothrix sp. PCC 7910]|uniref:DNA double-strand break repair nuclease NurA n=1 Tax=Tolypothrix sp. PCC 7910 TaxID=2099387 RepID=UPI00142776D1|nr:DNA double-strand break repair nuclease NurA [Tolypothrix sp. PCC 7910]QIR41755.1 DNA double-strand break repair nuclease NurA [Tolypothrix sp. PCC 7910]